MMSLEGVDLGIVVVVGPITQHDSPLLADLGGLTPELPLRHQKVEAQVKFSIQETLATNLRVPSFQATNFIVEQEKGCSFPPLGMSFEGPCLIRQGLRPSRI
jgi:hypothetical protein